MESEILERVKANDDLEISLSSVKQELGDYAEVPLVENTQTVNHWLSQLKQEVEENKKFIKTPESPSDTTSTQSPDLVVNVKQKLIGEKTDKREPLRITRSNKEVVKRDIKKEFGDVCASSTSTIDSHELHINNETLRKSSVRQTTSNLTDVSNIPGTEVKKTKRSCNETRSYECHLCQRRFKHRSNLCIHKRVVHKLEKNHECEICLKKFSELPELIAHRRGHTGEKPYECEVCQKKFGTYSHLTTHQRFHSGEKPYECNICEKRFAIRSHLKTHKRFHSGEKPYECSVCEKKFTTSTQLNTHKIIHTNEKPFDCDVCHRNYNSISGLIRHKRIHGKEKFYECDICQRKFRTSWYIKKHQLVHNVELDH